MKLMFDNLGLESFLIEELNRLNITNPTAVQHESIPMALKGSDILASAKTGSGKTMAYLLPIITSMVKSPKSRTLILVPTRELATQVSDSLYKLLGKRKGFSSVILIGGKSISEQAMILKRNPSIIIGTPGRICDHLMRKSLRLDKVKFLVLDEIDRMLDMNFSEQIDEIRKYLIEDDIQTFMFSATLPPRIEDFARGYLKNPARIAIDSPTAASLDIEQKTAFINESKKFGLLLDELQARDGSVIIFVKTKIGAEDLSNQLKENGYNAQAIHGDLKQSRRDRVLKDFRARKIKILVATDVAARGLDVPHIEHVINFDLPICPEDYVHRIGRTGRAGAKGFAISFITPKDERAWRNIQKFMNPKPANQDNIGERKRPAPKDNQETGLRQNNGRRKGRDFFAQEGDRKDRSNPHARSRDNNNRRRNSNSVPMSFIEELRLREKEDNKTFSFNSKTRKEKPKGRIARNSSSTTGGAPKKENPRFNSNNKKPMGNKRSIKRFD